MGQSLQMPAVLVEPQVGQLVHWTRGSMVIHTVSLTRQFPQRSPFALGDPHLGQKPVVRFMLESVNLGVGNVADHDTGFFIEESCGNGEFADAFSNDVGVGGGGEGGKDVCFGCAYVAVESRVDDNVAGGTGEDGIEKFAVADGDDFTLSGDIVYFEIHFCRGVLDAEGNIHLRISDFHGGVFRPIPGWCNFAYLKNSGRTRRAGLTGEASAATGETTDEFLKGVHESEEYAAALVAYCNRLETESMILGETPEE